VLTILYRKNRGNLAVKGEVERVTGTLVGFSLLLLKFVSGTLASASVPKTHFQRNFTDSIVLAQIFEQSIQDHFLMKTAASLFHYHAQFSIPYGFDWTPF